MKEKKEHKRRAKATALVTQGRSFNILDLAKTQEDLIEVGAQAGLAVGSIIDDFAEAFNSKNPPVVRLAKATRGAIAATTSIASAYETVKRLKENRFLNQQVSLASKSKSELRDEIVKLLKEHGGLKISDIASELKVSNQSLKAVIDELVSEGVIELS